MMGPGKQEWMHVFIGKTVSGDSGRGWVSETKKGGKSVRSVFINRFPVWAVGAQSCWASSEGLCRRCHKTVPLRPRSWGTTPNSRASLLDAAP